MHGQQNIKDYPSNVIFTKRSAQEVMKVKLTTDHECFQLKDTVG